MMLVELSLLLQPLSDFPVLEAVFLFGCKSIGLYQNLNVTLSVNKLVTLLDFLPAKNRAELVSLWSLWQLWT